jgi:5'-deoxynucleotidase YfbR-like HD superfamily hydrolase
MNKIKKLLVGNKKQTDAEKPKEEVKSERFEILKKLGIEHYPRPELYMTFYFDRPQHYVVDADKLEIFLKKAFDAGKKISEATGRNFAEFVEPAKPVTRAEVVEALRAKIDTISPSQIEEIIKRTDEAGFVKNEI